MNIEYALSLSRVIWRMIC